MKIENLETAVVDKFRSKLKELYQVIEDLDKLADVIKVMPERDKVVDALMDQADVRFTLLESAVPAVYLKRFTDKCYRLSLIEMINRKDPERKLCGVDGTCWHTFIKDKGVPTVSGIKLIREIFSPGLVSIQDGKAIQEFVLAGHL